MSGNGYKKMRGGDDLRGDSIYKKQFCKRHILIFFNHTILKGEKNED